MNRNLLMGSMAAVAVLVAACSCPCNVKDAAGVTPGTADDFEANVPNVVYFDFDSSKVLDSAKSRIEAQAAWLKVYTGTRANVEGHTDVRGTAEYNMALAQARANSVAKELTNLGVASDRVTTVSYGKERPVDTGTTETAHAKNRRTVTVVG